MQWLPTPKAIPGGYLMLLLVSSKLRCGYHLLALVRGLKGINNWLVHCALVIADIEPRTLRSYGKQSNRLANAFAHIVKNFARPPTTPLLRLS